MPEPNKRSRSLRRVHIRTPGGKNVVHYKKRKPKIAHCAECGVDLKGFKRELPHKMKKITKTKKRPQRPYPNLCSKCMRKRIIKEAKENV